MSEATFTSSEFPPVTGPDDAWWACTTEDGSAPDQGFPCMWDASVSGNTHGETFVLDFAGDVPHYVTQIGADGTVYTVDTPLTSSEVLTTVIVALVMGVVMVARMVRR